MKNRLPVFVAASGISLLLVVGCRQRGFADYAAGLPDLPPDLAATLDSSTMATRIPASHPPPVREPGAPVLAPCCGSTDTKTLKVNFSYTKCGPLSDFILAPLSDFVVFDASQGTGQGAGQGAGQARFRTFNLRELNGRSLLDQHVCVSSQGPWSATLTEDRLCNNYTPRQTLTISAFGDPVVFIWNGGVENHPPAIQLVSCREVATARFLCGGLSNCECLSSACPANDPCDCGLAGKW